MSILSWFRKEQWYTKVGLQRVYGAFGVMISMGLTLFTFVKVYGINVHPALVVPFMLFVTMCMNILGKLYEKSGFIRTDFHRDNKNNELLQEILRHVKER